MVPEPGLEQVILTLGQDGSILELILMIDVIFPLKKSLLRISLGPKMHSGQNYRKDFSMNFLP